MTTDNDNSAFLLAAWLFVNNFVIRKLFEWHDIYSFNI